MAYPRTTRSSPSFIYHLPTLPKIPYLSVMTKPAFLLLILLLSLSPLLQGQDEDVTLSDSFELFHNVYPTAKGFTLSITALDTSKTLKDLNRYFEEDWAQSYGEVVITTIQNGIAQRHRNTDDKLTLEQVEAIRKSDNGSTIAADLTYLPVGETDQQFRKNNFTFRIDPEDAQYVGGKEAMYAYLHKAITKIPEGVFEIYNVTSVNFSVDPTGAIVQAYINDTSLNEEADNILLQAVCDMPRWKPARYADGEVTQQNFVFVVGDKTSCTMNVLSIKNRVP